MKLVQTIKQEIFSPSSLIIVACISALYILLSDFFLSVKNILSFFSGNFGISYKINFVFLILLGFWGTLSLLDQILLLLNALLVGLNILLVYKTVSIMRHNGKMRLSIGGATLISLITSGCASCGISVITFLGLSSAFSFLPFRGLELHIGATVLLIASFIYMLRKLHQSIYCKIPVRK